MRCASAQQCRTPPCPGWKPFRLRRPHGRAERFPVQLGWRTGPGALLADSLELPSPLDDKPTRRRAGLVVDFGFGMQRPRGAKPSVIMDRLPPAQSQAVHSTISRRGAGLARSGISDLGCNPPVADSSVIMLGRVHTSQRYAHRAAVLGGCGIAISCAHGRS